jgi:putative glycosyltransferase
LFILYLLVQKFIVGVGLEGWTSVMAAVMLLGGVTLFFNGIIAIYVGTIFLEVKRRPTIIREVLNLDSAADLRRKDRERV